MARIVVYTLAMVALAGTALVTLLAYLPSLPANPSDGADTALRAVFVKTTAMVFAAGVLGGCLYNLRGLVKHTAANDFDPNHTLAYYLRPVSGGISGLIVFFLLLGGAITLNLGTAAGATSWATLQGRMPYIAFALLAGYGSHEFMLKLKDIAESVFALRGGKDKQ